MTLIGYVGLVYAFLGDIFIFKYSFSLTQATIVLMLLLINMGVIAGTMKKG